MKKLFLALAFIFISIFIFPVCVQADNESSGLNDIVDSINDKLNHNTDSDIQSILDDNGLDVQNPDAVEEIKAENILSAIWSNFKQALKSPLAMLGRLLSISLICIIVKSMCDENNALSKVFTLVSVLCTIMVIIDNVSNSLNSVKDSIAQINTYLVSYLPVFSSVSAVSGNVGGAGGYMAVMMLVSEVMGVISSKILIPFLSVVLAVIMISAVNSNSGLSEVAESVKKCVTWGLGGIMTIFTGLLTIQSITGSAADGLSSKAIKFAASSFIPVIGSSVSEAYSSVKGSLGVIRTSVGTIGIIVLFLIVLKPVVAILAVKLSVFLGKLVNDIFGNKEVATFLKSVNSVLSIGLSIIIAYLIFFVTATSLLMMTALNTGV